MFSGIIEEFATVVAIRKDRDNIDFTLRCSFVDQLGIDQSVGSQWRMPDRCQYPRRHLYCYGYERDAGSVKLRTVKGWRQGEY